METKSVTIMIIAVDTARADVSITPARTYYRFATDSSIEDGEIAAVKDFGDVAAALTEAAVPRDGEQPLPGEVKMQLYVNNRLTSGTATEQSLRRVVDILDGIAPEFSFLRGF